MDRWCSHKKCSISRKEYVHNLCIPLFCHLYMSIYTLNIHEEMIMFLGRFSHLFSSSIGSTLVTELTNLSDLKKLPPTLDVLR